MQNKIIVVEGRHDVSRLKQFNKNLNVISVNGSAIDENIDYLLELSKTNDIILFLDPDNAGERIRRILENKLTNVFHLHATKEQAKNKELNKVGIEYISDEDLDLIFKDLSFTRRNDSDIDNIFLFDNGIIGAKNSKEIRMNLSNYFKLGPVNGKMFLKRIRDLGVTKEEIKEVLENAKS